MNTNAADAAANWVTGMSSSTEKIRKNVQAVTDSPMEKAANAVQRQVDGVIRAANSGKTARKLRSVSLDDWKNAFLTKGLNRIQSGASTAKNKFAAFMQSFLPYLQQGVSQLPPRGDLEANIARMTSMVRHNANFKGQ